MMILILMIDLLGFYGFWYIWRNSRRKRNVDQWSGILFTCFCILDVIVLFYPVDILPEWLTTYPPFYWWMILIKCFLISIALMDIAKYTKKIKFETVSHKIIKH